MNNLIILTIRTFLIGAIVLGVLLFLPAWTLTYWQAWVFIVVFMGSANAIGVYLYLKDPELLERRKKGGANGGTEHGAKNNHIYCANRMGHFVGALRPRSSLHVVCGVIACLIGWKRADHAWLPHRLFRVQRK